MCILLAREKVKAALLLSYFLLREGKLPGIGDWRSEYPIELIVDRNLLAADIAEILQIFFHSDFT